MKNEVSKLRVTTEELVRVFLTVTKQSFIHLVTETEPRMNKRGNPYFGRVKKTTSGNFLICSDYSVRVFNRENKEHKEHTFEVEQNRVGEHLSPCVLFNENKGKHYLMYERFNETPSKVDFTCDGDPIEKALFDDYLVKSSGYQKQGLDRPVMVQSVSFENIKECTLNGVKYEVVNE